MAAGRRTRVAVLVVATLGALAAFSDAPARAALLGERGAGSSQPALARPAAERPRPERVRLVEIEQAMPITARPGGGRVVGAMPAGSRFYGTSTVAWVRRVSLDGRFGLVAVPYTADHVSGWIALRGLDISWTRIRVTADLSEHRITVRRGDRVLFRAPVATGAPGSPTPTGRYFVTDRVAFPGGGVLGTYAFGISGIQPRLPAGWTGGDQLAIHGTNAPSSIGRSASAGCLRASELVLDRLKPLLRLGTPVIVRA
jgi:lipoprotein-anchoring transpeptidase ErfK/SrfK